MMIKFTLINIIRIIKEKIIIFAVKGYFHS